MLFLDLLLDLVHRVSHPGSLPNDVATDLGLEIYGRLSVNELLGILKDPAFRSDNLKKFMRKATADALFQRAARKDIFQHTSRFSYFFGQGLLEIVLDFDTEERLRRAYVQFQNSKGSQMVEIHLEATSFYSLTQKLS